MQRGIGHADIVKSYIGTLCLGKNNLEENSFVGECHYSAFEYSLMSEYDHSIMFD